MGAFALSSEEAQQFDRPAAGAAEPVRNPGAELGGLAVDARARDVAGD